MTNKAPKLVAKVDLALEAAQVLANEKHDISLKAACAKAGVLGANKALGANSLTQLCYDYQAGVFTGDLRRGDNVALYTAYADSHDHTIAGMPNSGLKVFSKETRDTGINLLLTFSDPYVIHQASAALYTRIIKARDDMDPKELAPGSALSHFARVNRAIAKRGEETAASIAPDALVISDSDIVAMLAKEGVKAKTNGKRLQDVIDALKKFEKLDPEIFAAIMPAMRMIRTVKADVDQAEIKAELAAEEQAIIEAAAAVEREKLETSKILAASVERQAA